MALHETLQQTIKHHALFTQDDLVLVAISGGPDSTSLLHALRLLGYNVHAAHLNHGFRGEEAEEDVVFVRDLCKRLDIPLTCAFRDVPSIKKQEKLSAQVAARRVRYAFLEDAADQVGAQCIATAHNQDDRVETMLLNIVRGTGTDGLRGIPYRRPPFVRPLLDVPRDEIEYYCEEHNLVPRRDSSNYSSVYARNNIRKELVPYLERRYNESVRACLVRLSDIASAESDLLQDMARRWIGEATAISAERLAREPIALQRRVIREFIRQMRRDQQLTDIGHETVERVRLSIGSEFAIMLPGADYLIYGDSVSLSIRPAPRREETFDLDIEAPMNIPIPFLQWEVSVIETPESVDVHSLRVRTWQTGDRMKTSAGTRKLQDIFTDAKVPRDERRQWPVLVDRDGIVAVPNLAYAARARGLVVHLARGRDRVSSAGPSLAG